MTKGYVTHETVRNPQMLADLLNKTATELGEVRSLINELKADHATTKTYNDAVTRMFNHMTFTNAGLAASSSTSSSKTLKTVNAIHYAIAGKPYTKSAATSIAFTASSHDVTASKWAMFLVAINASGTFDITKGSEASAKSSAALPSLPSSMAPVGAVRGKGGTSGWSATTEKLSSASGLTSVVYFDILAHPNGVLTSTPSSIAASSVSQYLVGGS